MTTPRKMRQWIKWELECLWQDLETASRRSHAPEGQMSIEMKDILDRIKSATEIVGPISWWKIPITMTGEGRYKTLCNAANIECSYPTEEEYKKHIAPYMKQIVGH